MRNLRPRKFSRNANIRFFFCVLVRSTIQKYWGSPTYLLTNSNNTNPSPKVEEDNEGHDYFANRVEPLHEKLLEPVEVHHPTLRARGNAKQAETERQKGHA